MNTALSPNLMHCLAERYRNLPDIPIGDADDTLEIPAIDDVLLVGIMEMFKAVPADIEEFVSRKGIVPSLVAHRSVRVRIMTWNNDASVDTPEFRHSQQVVRERMSRLEAAWNGNVEIKVLGPREDGLDAVFTIVGPHEPEPITERYSEYQCTM